jgi:gliding motility-associated-like protein
MKSSIKKLVLAFSLLLSGKNFSQYIQVDDTFTATQLVQNFFSTGGCASVSNITVSGGNFGNADKSYGKFTNATSVFPFTNGIVLSTGKAISTIGPNSGNSSEGDNSWLGDSNLEQALGVSNTINATVLEFDFVPVTNKISFDYIFASEQYLSNPSASQCGYTDGFAFLLKPVGAATYQNLAVVPGTSTPVTVSTVRGGGTVCNASNVLYFDAFNGVNYPTTFNGQTKILKAKADVISGTTYHIKLVIADQGNALYDSAIFLGAGSFESTTDLGIDKLEATNNPFCEGTTNILNATQPGTNTYKWFKNGVFTGITSAIYTITDNTNFNVVEYAVEVTLSGACTSSGKVNIQFTKLPVVVNQTLVQCDDDADGITKFNLKKLDNLITTSGTVTYYATIGGIAITNPTNYNSTNATIYAEVENPFGCKKTANITLQVSNNAVVSPINYKKCDTDALPQDGKTEFNLNTEVNPLVLFGLPTGLIVEYYNTKNDAIAQSNPLPNIFPKTDPSQQSIFARIINGSDCYGIIEVKLEINIFNPSNFETEIIGLCQGNKVTLSVASTFASYVWSNGDLDFETDVTTAGNYSVIVTDANGCKATKQFIVKASAPATEIDAVVDDFSENNIVTITYKDNGGDYIFSIDGINYQDSPLFNNVPTGEITIYIKDRNGCLPIASKLIYILNYPKFFTPNGDGINDTWLIPNVKTRPNTTISIFDRFGKLLSQLNVNSKGWNGTFNGQNLPSGDYWFVLTLFNNKTVRSHFALKR